MSDVIRIGTRESKLALWQAEHVYDILTKAYPEKKFEIKGMSTHGDKDQLKPLSQFGTKSIFTKELDVALLTNTVDIVVHCMKDLATTLPEGIEFCAVMERGKVADAVLINDKHKDLLASLNLNDKPTDGSLYPCPLLSALPAGAVVGTSALRRQAMLSRLHPQITFKDIRGNVGTRISKLDSGMYDAIILANIGLDRLELSDRVATTLDIDTYQYAVGQGALAIACREGDNTTKTLIANILHDKPTSWACYAERGLLAGLQGGCKVPIAIDTKHVLVSTEDAEKFSNTMNNSVIEWINKNTDDVIVSKEKTNVIIKTDSNINQLTSITSCTGDEKCAVLYVVRATVLSLDGKKIIQTPYSFYVQCNQGNFEQGEQIAWDAGVALSQHMLKFGAMDILNEIRA